MADKYALPEFAVSRIRYYDGLFLSDTDFIEEQNYHTGARVRHEGLLHTAGITEGLDASITSAGASIDISAGSALDGEGRQILVAEAKTIYVDPLWSNGARYLEMTFLEAETGVADQSSTVSAATRFTQSPTFTLNEAQTANAILIAAVTIDGGLAAELDTSLRVYSGVRLPVPTGCSAIELVSSNDGTTAELSSKLRVAGATTLEETLGVAGATSLANTLVVAGATSLDNALTVAGATAINNTLGVTGNTTLASASGSTLTVPGATAINNTLGVTGNTTLASASGSTLTVPGATAINNTLGVTGNTTLASASGSTLTVPGATAINNTLGVTGNTTLASASGSTLTVSGATTLSNTLGVVGNTTLTGTLTANNVVKVNNIFESTGNTTLASGSAATLAVNGSTKISNALEVTGNVTLATDTSRALTVTGAATVNNDLTATGNVTLATGTSKTLTVTGVATVNNDFTSTGNVTLASGASKTLTVPGGATFSSTVSVTGNVTLASGTSKTLTVPGGATFSSTVSVTGNVTLATGTSKTLTVTGAATVNNDLTATGHVTLASGSGKTLTVTGAASLNSTLSVSGASTFSSDMTVSCGGGTNVRTLTFDNATTARILFKSSSNALNDWGYILFQSDSSFVDNIFDTADSSAENARLSIGVRNDYANLSGSKPADAVDIQGSAQLTLNAGAWDSELTSLIGSQWSETGMGSTNGISFRIDNTEKMRLNGSQFTVGTDMVLSGARTLKFDNTSKSQILWTSSANYGSDSAFIVYLADSSQHGTNTENGRLSIGVYNDFGATASDALDLQGGYKLKLNAGDWDTELESVIGATGVNSETYGISLCVNNSEKMKLNANGITFAEGTAVAGIPVIEVVVVTQTIDSSGGDEFYYNVTATFSRDVISAVPVIQSFTYQYDDREYIKKICVDPNTDGTVSGKTYKFTLRVMMEDSNYDDDWSGTVRIAVIGTLKYAVTAWS